MKLNDSASRLLLLSLLFISSSPLASDWQSVIRQLPYAASQGFHKNLSTIRQWVLLQKGFCEESNRHILFSERGRFLGYIDNAADSVETQKKLNVTRHKLHTDGRVKRVIPGDADNIGFPFALNCDQPHADIYAAQNRLAGKQKSDRLWGTWDGMEIGTSAKPVPLYQLIDQVYQIKSRQFGQAVEPEEFRYFLAQAIIESGARKDSLSPVNAIGLLQLRPQVLKDCQIPEKFYRHRMAQVDCAVRLFQQNRRNLRPAFDSIFSHLPKAKQSLIFSQLLVQAYHSGVGRMRKLLTDKQFNQASLYFAKHHQRYSGEDIASGVIFHNLGREELGFASLFYVIDIAITAQSLCQQSAFKDAWFCATLSDES